MRSSRILRWALVPAVLATLALQQGASATQSAGWSGKTDPQGLPITFTISQQGTNAVISEMDFEFDMTCEDGQSFGLETGFFGFDVPIVNNRFSFVFVELDQALQWKGRFDSPIHASGTVQSAMPGLTQDVQAELCESQLQSFAAHPNGAGAGADRPFHADVRLTVTKDSAGKVHVSTSSKG